MANSLTTAITSPWVSVSENQITLSLMKIPTELVSYEEEVRREEGRKGGFPERWGRKEGALSGDYFMSNCTAYYQRRLVEPGFQGNQFGDTLVRTLDATQRGD